MTGVEIAVDAIAQLKPKLRGWLHAGALPTAVIAGIFLIVLAPSPLRVQAIIYVTTSVALFGISATYHRGHWGPKAHAVLKRLDHSTIFLFIAGTYTAFVAATLTGASEAILLWAIWICALLGVAFRVLWVGAPRWLTVPVYLSMGWAAVVFMPEIWRQSGVWIFMLLALGGLFYIVGAVIYGLKRPDPSPTWFGFHEVFHSCTLGGYIAHFVGIALAFGAFAVA